ncbi:shikimate kinase [Variovorax sp. GB1P17]|uniref:shikimate kinase n=1 Tax=Variovorax sp. GB1P17 TaxID=3443740 RepID=UPI003F46D23A
MTSILHLVGPGGAGKTSVGPLLGQQLGWQFLDLDAQFMRQEGDIASCIEAHGYAGYAKRNVAVYSEICHTLKTPAVLALSSGFLIYPADVDARDPALRAAIEHDPLTALLMPSFELEPCVDTIVRRQLARPYLAGDRVKEERRIRERFPRFMALQCARFLSDGAPARTALEIARFAAAQERMRIQL